jgi:LysM repeat protein
MLPSSDPMARGPAQLVTLPPPPPAPSRPSPTVLSMGTSPATQPPNPGATDPATPSGTLPPGGTPESAPPVRDPLAGGPAPMTAPGGAGAPAPASAVQPGFGGSLPFELQELTTGADRAQSAGRLAEARGLLNHVLLDARTSATDRAGLRARIAQINETTLFSPAASPSDPLVDQYSVVSGDSLTRIGRKTGSVSEPALIARINRMSNPNALRVGQSLKILRGPFHAVVSKSQFRMDIYAGPVPAAGAGLGMSGLPDGAEPGWTYIRSFAVGHGETGSTPIANFVVRENSKLVDPAWANPRTGERFAASDPKNPIGEHWIGLDGLDEYARKFTGYGVHGTIEPDSIGQERSMGCVRLLAADVEFVYELLMPRVSIVKIVP